MVPKKSSIQSIRFACCPSFGPAVPFAFAMFTVSPVRGADLQSVDVVVVVNASPSSVTSIALSAFVESLIAVIVLF